VGKAKRAHHSLSERSRNIFQVAAPIGCEQPMSDKTMKAAMRPVYDTRGASMLHWIEVDIVDMALEICVIADCMLPIATLPDAFFAL
jgi:hypothetical protein